MSVTLADQIIIRFVGKMRSNFSTICASSAWLKQLDEERELTCPALSFGVP